MINTNVILNFLNREHYQSYHIPVARYLKSIEAAIIFMEFVQRHQFHEARDEIINIPNLGTGWFYHTKEKIEERTAINRYNQDKAVDILKEFKLIETVQYGMPCKRYIRLNFNGFEELSKFLCRKLTFDQQVSLPSADKSTDLQPTVSVYIKEPKEESNKEREAAAPPPPTRFSVVVNKKEKLKPKPQVEKKAYRENILLSESEHEKLLKQFGEAKLNWMLDHLEAKKGAKDYVYKSDYHVLMPAGWVNAEYQKQSSAGKVLSSNVASPEQIEKNRKTAELAEELLRNYFTGYVYIQAQKDKLLIYHKDKDIQKYISYEESDPKKFKESLIKELERLFPRVKELFGVKNG